jgi:hypothetical protein
VFAFAERQAEVKERNQKREGACLFVFVHFYRNQKWNKKLGLCFVHGGLHWFREDVRYYLDYWLIGKLRKSLGEMNYT